MKQNLALALFSLLLIGLVGSCSKEDTPAPVSPIVGQWDINRATITGVPNSFTTLLRNGDRATADLDTDTYIFKSDSTYTEEYDPGSTGPDETGKWVLTGTTLRLAPTGSTPPYPLTYSVSASELTFGPTVITQSVYDPVTRAYQTLSYTVIIVYRKKS